MRHRALEARDSITLVTEPQWTGAGNTMESHAKLLGHPAHQILIVFPLGLLAGSFLFDLAYLVTDITDFPVVSFWTISLGIASGVIAGVFGFIDWRAIPAGTRAKRIGAWHGGGNLLVLGLFVMSWIARRGDLPGVSTAALTLSAVGVALSGITGWLGGELVDRLGVGVDDGAHLNAPSSLSSKRATEQSHSYPNEHRT